MALIEDVIFSDPVLQRIFFDKRRFAPRSYYSSSQVAIGHGAGLEGATDNTRELGGRMLDQVEKRGGFIAPELAQRDLF